MMVMSREYQGARDGKDEGKKREVNVGTSGWVEEAMVTKKIHFGRNHFPSPVFSVHHDPFNHPALHVDFQEVFCEMGGWVNLSEKCSQFFHPL